MASLWEIFFMFFGILAILAIIRKTIGFIFSLFKAEPKDSIIIKSSDGSVEIKTEIKTKFETNPKDGIKKEEFEEIFKAMDKVMDKVFSDNKQNKSKEGNKQ